MALSYLPFLALGSMGESCVNMKVDHSISIGKYVWVSKGVSIQDFNNVRHDFSLVLYLLNSMYLTDALNIVCKEHLYTR